jgi:hypothetical protein
MGERRRGVRVPVCGVAVFHAGNQAIHGEIENLSSDGALIAVQAAPEFAELELKLGMDTSWVRARTVRSEAQHVAVEFEAVDTGVRASIDLAIEGALRAAQRRRVLVLDERNAQRHSLVSRLTARGMTPLAPRTPLEAIDLLSRAPLQVNVCLLAPSFGQSSAEIRAWVTDSFPWVNTAEISDDLDDTVERAFAAWSSTPVARLAGAMA